MDTIVFYHHNCPDGFSAAWVAWKKLKDKAEYKWLDYQAPFNYDFRDKTLYFLDVVPGKADFRRLLKRNRIIVIDHHISSEQMIKKATDYSFSLGHCAAVLAWHYFFPKRRMPRLLKYVEDLDLWKFRQPYSKEINAAISTVDFDFQQWSKLARRLETTKGRREYIKEGRAIMNYKNKIIEKVSSRAQRVIFAGKEALAVNSSVLVSEIGNALLQRQVPVAIIWFETKDKRKVSLRSDGTVNVAELAEKYNGGGHRQAAGFVLDIKRPLPWKNL